MIDKKVTEWTTEEREELKNIIINRLADININSDFHISVVGSFANTKMYLTDTSDIDVVVWYGDHYLGRLFRLIWQDRVVNVVGKSLADYPRNLYFGEELSHYSLTEDRFYEGADDEKRAFKKRRLIGDVVHCDFCGAEVDKNDILQLQVLVSKHGIVREKFVCKKCYNEERYLNC